MTSPTEERVMRAREVLAAAFVQHNPGYTALPWSNMVSAEVATDAMLAFAEDKEPTE